MIYMDVLGLRITNVILSSIHKILCKVGQIKKNTCVSVSLYLP